MGAHGGRASSRLCGLTADFLGCFLCPLISEHSVPGRQLDARSLRFQLLKPAPIREEGQVTTASSSPHTFVSPLSVKYFPWGCNFSSSGVFPQPISILKPLFESFSPKQASGSWLVFVSVYPFATAAIFVDFS